MTQQPQLVGERKRKYNTKPNSTSFKKGHNVSKEVRKKISKANKGRIAWNKGKKYKSKPLSEKTKKKISKILTGRKLSKEHRKKLSEVHIGIQKGKNHPNWKGGITPEIIKLRHSLQYIAWRNEVYKRDNYTCRICKEHCEAGKIIAHHLKLFSEFPELRYSVDNGITLCRSCHARLHQLIKNYGKQ